MIPITPLLLRSMSRDITGVASPPIMPDAGEEARRGYGVRSVNGVGGYRGGQTPERDVAYCVEELPDEICDAHVDYLERRRLNSREEFRTAEEHDSRYSERYRDEEQIGTQFSEIRAGLVNKGSHQRVVECIPDAHDGYHRCDRCARYAEHGHKEECQLHADHVVSDDLTAVCYAVDNRFFYSDVSFFFQPFVVSQFVFLLRARKAQMYFQCFRIRL